LRWEKWQKRPKPLTEFELLKERLGK